MSGLKVGQISVVVNEKQANMGRREFTHDVVTLLQQISAVCEGGDSGSTLEIEPGGLLGTLSIAKLGGLARLFKEVLGRLERCLPGSNIYIGLPQPGGTAIKGRGR